MLYFSHLVVLIFFVAVDEAFVSLIVFFLVSNHSVPFGLFFIFSHSVLWAVCTMFCGLCVRALQAVPRSALCHVVCYRITVIVCVRWFVKCFDVMCSHVGI